jgi:plastocyanin domain-containing protein
MLNNKLILGTIASFGLMLGIASSETVAQMPHEMSRSPTPQMSQFRRIEQPLWLKGAVTLGGLSLIGLELWWFLLSKPKSQTAVASQGVQEVTIAVDGKTEVGKYPEGTRL